MVSFLVFFAKIQGAPSGLKDWLTSSELWDQDRALTTSITEPRLESYRKTMGKMRKSIGKLRENGGLLSGFIQHGWKMDENGEVVISCQ